MPNNFILFVFGAAFGSFLNVVALRYDPDKFLFGRQLLGRSSCSFCGRKLKWFELAPTLSFILERGRCRGCGARLSLSYLLAEVLSGLIFVFVPPALKNPFILYSSFFILASLWVLVFETLLLVALIDLRLKIIPDEANALLALAGAAVTLAGGGLPEPARSFIGPYALIFGLRGNIWLNHFTAALAGAAVFGVLIAVTRGRGMGMGDLKLAVPLGLVFGWPDIIFVAAFSFVIGSVVGALKIAANKADMKSAIPFGPFLALGAATVFFWGEEILRFYFGLFPT